jgi:hypothetical protein
MKNLPFLKTSKWHLIFFFFSLFHFVFSLPKVLTSPSMDFETSAWSGGEYVSEPVKSGMRALLWKNQWVLTEVSCADIPHDWSSYGQLRFYLNSATNNNAKLVILLESKNAGGDYSYYNRSLVIDWKGWKEVSVPFYSFGQSRNPAGWNKIDRIRFSVNGWDAKPVASSEWVIDGIRLTGTPDANQNIPSTTPLETRFLSNLNFAPNLVETIEPLVSEEPVHLGISPKDRAFWDKLKTNTFFTAFLMTAEDEVSRAVPELGEKEISAYLTNVKGPYNEALSRRIAKLNLHCFSEAMLNDGRHLKALEDTIEAFLVQGAWANPVHMNLDRREFVGEIANVDLEASHRAMMLAMCVDWYGDRFKPGLVERIKSEIRRRIWTPYLDAIRTNSIGLKQFFWVTSEANWNPVCHSGVIGSALLLEKDQHFRAQMIACSETFLPRVIRGFFEDGYTPEGIAYWNYGFTHYLLLSELVARSTSGKINHEKEPKVQQIMLSGRNLAIASGIFPAFGDAHGSASPMLNWYIDRRNHTSESMLIPYEQVDGRFYPFLALLLEVGTPTTELSKANPSLDLRTWFDDAQVLVCRSGNPVGSDLGFAIKAGANDGNHHHIDNGSYTIASGGGSALGDPGADVYVYNLASNRSQWESQLKNSYGHPVPLVAGKQQENGPDYRAEITSIITNADFDEVVIDLKGSYAVPELKKLTRCLRLDRTKKPALLTVEDEVEFETPRLFETALMSRTFGTSNQEGGLYFGLGSARVHVNATAVGGKIAVKTEDKLFTWGRKGDIRTGYYFTEPVLKAKIKLSISGAPLKNEILLPPNPTAANDFFPKRILCEPDLLTTNPEKLFDNNLESVWESGGNPQLILDFEEAKTFREIGISHQVVFGRRYRLLLEYSVDLEHWENPELLTTSGLSASLDFEKLSTTKKCRYLRITGQGNTQSVWNAWSEVRFR